MCINPLRKGARGDYDRLGQVAHAEPRASAGDSAILGTSEKPALLKEDWARRNLSLER